MTLPPLTDNLRRFVVARSPGAAIVAMSLAAILASCGGGASRAADFRTLNESGVTGTVTLTDLGGSRTRVAIAVDPAGNADMPAHIHPGHCAHMVPQPAYPLENVRDGRSTTDIAADYDELLTTRAVVNIHKSNGDLETFTACAEID